MDAAIASVDEAREPEVAASLLRLRAGLRQQLLLPGQFDDLHAALRLAASPGRARVQALCQLIRALMMRDRYDEDTAVPSAGAA